MRVLDPEECHDQKTAGGTFDMFDAKCDAGRANPNPNPNPTLTQPFDMFDAKCDAERARGTRPVRCCHLEFSPFAAALLNGPRLLR